MCSSCKQLFLGLRKYGLPSLSYACLIHRVYWRGELLHRGPINFSSLGLLFFYFVFVFFNVIFYFCIEFVLICCTNRLQLNLSKCFTISFSPKINPIIIGVVRCRFREFPGGGATGHTHTHYITYFLNGGLRVDCKQS